MILDAHPYADDPMARAMSEHDWLGSDLGSPAEWHPALRTAAGMCLRSDAISAVYWGPDFSLLYNEATIPVLGARHPQALGRPARDVWADTWPQLEPLMRQVVETGREVTGSNSRFALDSQGRRTESYYDVSFTPIIGDDGKVLGIYAQGRETTPLVLAERMLTRDRARYSEMMEHAPGVFCLLRGADLVLEFFNPAAATILGHGAVVGQPLRSVLHEADTQPLPKLLAQALGGSGLRSESAVPVHLLRADGGRDTRYLDLVLQPLRSEAGEVAGLVLQGIDVSGSVAATLALAESEERFRVIAERAPVMLWMSNPEGRCVYLNALLRQFWGVDAEAVASFDWTSTVHPEDLEALSNPWAEGMRNHRGFEVEARFRGADGQYRILHTTAEPRRNSDGSFAGMIGVNVDVDDTRRLEQRLRREQSHLELLNRTGAQIAADLDLEKVVQAVTDAGVELTGAQFGAFFYNVTTEKGESYRLYSLSGVPRSAFEGFPMPRATAVFRPTFDGEGVVRSDDIRADPRYGQSEPHRGLPPGHLPVRSYLAVPVRSRSGDVLGGLFFGHAETARFEPEHERAMMGIAAQAAVAIDNARLFQQAERENQQRSAAEARLQQLNETLEMRVAEEIAIRREAEAALQQAQKMESIGQLTGGIAHDFNNLLQVIGGNLHLLAKDVAGVERAERKVASALAGVSRGGKLASQLLAFGRRQALEPRTINIGRLVAGMDEMLRRTLGETIEIESIVAGGLWNCFVDPSHIENAILNLAINARDAMTGPGKLTIEAGNASIDDAYARQHPDATPGQYVVLAVTDTGCGIPPDLLERVFEPFFSTKEEGKGTGLGLSMVYGLVKQSGGHVRIYSEPDNGTTVRLYLPRAEGEEDFIQPLDIGPLVGGRETILVAEDDEGVRETVVELLSELGYRVLKARDAAAAWTVIESGVAVDLLFSDVVMPGALKSSELARKAVQSQPGMVVLFTSGYTENSIVHGGVLDPGVELLPKPYTREALARKVRQVLGSRPERAAPAEATVPAARPDGEAGLRILLVEDDALILMTTAETLREFGHEVAEAASAEHAMTLLAADEHDILVSDITLPGRSGHELAEHVRRQHPQMGVVLASGHADPSEAGSPDGFVSLAKPYNAAELAAALRAARKG